ncbi:endo-1,4-beta-xylanase [Micromonospora sp. NBC_01655]|uniref:endo-1,4-beta-xylanase n=1 Tax=Micromonospora sp. NBC_01655 TaxID=2975983 RepID=UPI00338DF8C8
MAAGAGRVAGRHRPEHGRRRQGAGCRVRPGSASRHRRDPRYRELVRAEFSTVTAENVMRRDALEPTRGSYDWGRTSREFSRPPPRRSGGPPPRRGAAARGRRRR